MLGHDGLEPRPKLDDRFAQNSAIAHDLVPDRLDALLEGIQRLLIFKIRERTDASFHFFILNSWQILLASQPLALKHVSMVARSAAVKPIVLAVKATATLKSDTTHCGPQFYTHQTQ